MNAQQHISPEVEKCIYRLHTIYTIEGETGAIILSKIIITVGDQVKRRGSCHHVGRMQRYAPGGRYAARKIDDKNGLYNDNHQRLREVSLLLLNSLAEMRPRS